MFARERIYVNNHCSNVLNCMERKIKFVFLRALYLHIKKKLHRDFANTKHSGVTLRFLLSFCMSRKSSVLGSKLRYIFFLYYQNYISVILP